MSNVLDIFELDADSISPFQDCMVSTDEITQEKQQVNIGEATEYRKRAIARFLEKRKKYNYENIHKYKIRSDFAKTRKRVNGKFIVDPERPAATARMRRMRRIVNIILTEKPSKIRTTKNSNKVDPPIENQMADLIENQMDMFMTDQSGIEYDSPFHDLIWI
jgi:hypothetical protein